MAVPLASPHDDTGEFRRRFVDTDRGQEATLFFRVNTRDFDRVFLAQGLPPKGAAYSAVYPDLTVIRRDITAWGGADDPAEQTGGWCMVQVDYSTPTIEVLPFKLGRLYSVLDFEDEVRTEKTGLAVVDGNVTAQRINIGNGEGWARLVGNVRATIVQHLNVNAHINWPKIIDLTNRKPVNDRAVTIPAIIGSGFPFLMAKGEMQYLGPRVTPTGEGLIVEHTVSLRPNFFGDFYEVDPNGNPVGDAILFAGYPFADLTGLW